MFFLAHLIYFLANVVGARIGVFARRVERNSLLVIPSRRRSRRRSRWPIDERAWREHGLRMWSRSGWLFSLHAPFLRCHSSTVVVAVVVIRSPWPQPPWHAVLCGRHVRRSFSEGGSVAKTQARRAKGEARRRLPPAEQKRCRRLVPPHQSSFLARCRTALTSATALQSLPMLSSSPRTVRALRFEEVANLECGGRA